PLLAVATLFLLPPPGPPFLAAPGPFLLPATGPPLLLAAGPALLPAPGRSPADRSPPGLRTCSPLRPRKSFRASLPARVLLPSFSCNLAFLYPTPCRCCGLCCQLLPTLFMFVVRLPVILLFPQPTPPPHHAAPIATPAVKASPVASAAPGKYPTG